MNSDPTIEQMNEAIALFMGYEKYEDEYGVWFKYDALIKCLHPNLQSLEYHSSWDDWLMPVIKKILYETNAENTEARIRENLLKCDITATHASVFKFIQWYNKLKEVTNG